MNNQRQKYKIEKLNSVKVNFNQVRKYILYKILLLGKFYTKYILSDMVQIDFYRVEILNFRFLTLIIHFTLFLHYGMDKGFSYVKYFCQCS